MKLSKEMSYIYGFFAGDGTLRETTRNRGSFSSEISSRDAELFYKMQQYLPNAKISYRTRDTNFSKNYKSVKIAVYDLEFRTLLKKCGFPVGKKHLIISPPCVGFSEIDFIRGYLDADGSICYRTEKNGKKDLIVSFVISSETLYKFFQDYFTKEFGYTPKLKRNKRDNVYNLIAYTKNAKKLLDSVYYDGCLCLDRKYKKYLEFCNKIEPLC